MRLPLYIIRPLCQIKKRCTIADWGRRHSFHLPDKLNAWTAGMESEVRAAMGEAEHDDNIRLIVLTGTGRGFCSGPVMLLLNTVAENGLDG